MCRLAWGAGPWDGLSQDWREAYPIEQAPSDVRALVTASLPILADVARLTLATPTHGFRGRALVDIVSPDRVSPRALADLERKLGPALYTSPHWIWTECLRLLALTALADDGDTATATPRPTALDWMLRLGGVQQAA
jgi:hypothetical protein